VSGGAADTIGGAYATELAAAERLALEAGALVLKYRDGDLGVEMKAGDEPVTIADRAASDLIVQGLERAFPSDVVISEERADNLARLKTERVWYVDPIDGTKDFIRGETGFAVMIGLARSAAPVVGVLYQPTADRLFLAAKESGTWLVEAGGAPRRLRCSEISDPADIRLVASKSHRSRTIDRVKSTLGIADELNIGSVGLKLGVIATGERDLYVNAAGRTKLWDTCGPQVVLEEAGGTLTDLHGDPLRYDIEETRNRGGLLATNGRVHDAVVQKLSPIFPREA
jgi:3'(2'), 5'-bisphosphate nucleotidase